MMRRQCLFVQRFLMKQRDYINSAIALLALAGACCAQVDPAGFSDISGKNAGTTVFQSLLLPPGASALARNETAIPYASDASDLPLFASSSALFMRDEFALGHLEWLMNTRSEYIGAAFPKIAIGTFGGYARVFTATGFDHARDIDENTADPHTGAAEVEAGFTVARQLLIDRLSIGAGVHYIESHLNSIAARSASLSVDLLAAPASWLHIANYVRNIGPSTSYDGGITKESQPATIGTALIVSPIQPHDTLPRAVSLDFGLGVRKTVFEPLVAALGFSFKPFSFLSFMGGYEYHYGVSPGLPGLSAGLGFHVGHIGMDAGWRYVNAELGHAWGVNIKYNTSDIIPRSAEDHYKAALRFYDSEHWRLCVQYARKALAINPDMWKAYELMTRALSNIYRQHGTEVALLWSANTRGEFAPRDVNGSSMGGLAREAGLINKVRSQYAGCALIDAGNMVTSSTPAEKVRLAGIFFGKMSYTALAVGSCEMARGFQSCIDDGKESGLPFVSTTKPLPSSADYRILNAGKYKVAVLSSTNPDASSIPLLQSTLSIPEIDKCALRILVCDGSWENLLSIAAHLPELNVIIATGLPQRFDAPMKENNVQIVSTGSDGLDMGALYARFTGNGVLASLRCELLPINATVPPDPAIEAIVRKSTVTAQLDSAGMPKGFLKEGPTSGVFPFVTDRHGGQQVYLFTPKKHVEVPISAQYGWCGDPIVSFSSENILFLAGPSKDSATLHSINISGLDDREMPCGGFVRDFTVSPDGIWICATVVHDKGISEIVRLQMGGGRAQSVLPSWTGSKMQPVWSNDLENLFFICDRDGRKNLYMAGSSGSDPLRITDDGNNYQPAISPDGKHIAIISDRENAAVYADIWIHDVSTGHQTRLTRNADAKELFWADNHTLVYSAGKHPQIYRCTIENHDSTVLSPAGKEKNWSEGSPRPGILGSHEVIFYTRDYNDGHSEIRSFDPLNGTDTSVLRNQGNNRLK